MRVGEHRQVGAVLDLVGGVGDARRLEHLAVARDDDLVGRGIPVLHALVVHRRIGDVDRLEAELLGDSFRNTPADYFGPTSGYGRVFASLREIDPKKPLSVGVIGLGAGVLAAWMKPGDRLVFYEISPRVVDIAQREFTFLADTAAPAEVVIGDGRLSLEREPPRGYDLLGIDAFSGEIGRASCRERV